MYESLEYLRSKNIMDVFDKILWEMVLFLSDCMPFKLIKFIF